jgi:hypothetical protein
MVGEHVGSIPPRVSVAKTETFGGCILIGLLPIVSQGQVGRDACNERSGNDGITNVSLGGVAVRIASPHHPYPDEHEKGACDSKEPLKHFENGQFAVLRVLLREKNVQFLRLGQILELR